MNISLQKVSILVLSVAMVVIFYFAFSPGPKTPAFVVNHDKAFHFLTFFCMSVVLISAFPDFNKKGQVLVLILFAVSIELVQFLFVNRGFSLLDICYDVCGISAFYLLLILYKPGLRNQFISLDKRVQHRVLEDEET